MVRVFIDHGRCEGTGYCVQIRRDLFQLDDDGLAELAVPPDDPALQAARDELEEAENLCPTGAISLVG